MCIKACFSISMCYCLEFNGHKNCLLFTFMTTTIFAATAILIIIRASLHQITHPLQELIPCMPFLNKQYCLLKCGLRLLSLSLLLCAAMTKNASKQRGSQVSGSNNVCILICLMMRMTCTLKITRQTKLISNEAEED